MAEAVIDARELLDQRDRERERDAEEQGVDGARGGADLRGGRRAAPVGARVLVGGMAVLILGLLVVLGVKAYRVRKAAKESGPHAVPTERVERRGAALNLPPREPPPGPSVQEASLVPPLRRGGGFPGEAPVAGEDPSGRVPAASGGEVLAPPSAPNAAAGRPAPTQQETALQRRLARGFGNGTSGDGGGGGEGLAAAGPAVPAAAPAFPEDRLEPTEVKGISAMVLVDRDYWLTQGTVLDCALETKIVSTVPGKVSCYLTRDVYSTNGRVVLLDRGTRLVGDYQSGMQQGQVRIGVVWARAETPKGVFVSVDSPGTGALGEAGVGGWTDTHFWDRFGGAIMVSLIGSATDAAAARLAGPARNATISLDPTASATKDVVTQTYSNTINMPPTVYVNQGERVGVFLAHDLNFRKVYDLERSGDE